MVKMKSCLL